MIIRGERVFLLSEIQDGAYTVPARVRRRRREDQLAAARVARTRFLQFTKIAVVPPHEPRGSSLAACVRGDEGAGNTAAVGGVGRKPTSLPHSRKCHDCPRPAQPNRVRCRACGIKHSRRQQRRNHEAI